MKAIWKDTVIAESNDTVVVEGNHYFPPDSVVDKEYLRASDTTTACPWKGSAHYYSIAVGDETNPDAAWYYPEPKEAAKNIRGRIAFWKGVQVVE